MNQREAFEKWVEDHGLQDDGEDSQYSVAAYSWAKRAWQAATEIEREACAKIAEQTVCDTHIPTGVKIYGTRAAKNIRDRK